MASAKSRYAPSGQTVATGRGLYIRRVSSEYSFLIVFSPRVILSASPLDQNSILGNTDLGEVAETAPPTSDGSESNLSGPAQRSRPGVTGSGRWEWLPPNLVTPREVKSLRLVGVYIFGE